MVSFKTCPCCEKSWETQKEFVFDKTLELIGYSADFDVLENGLFYFVHQIEGCGTTLAIEASRFQNLYDGPIYNERKTGTSECPGYCEERELLGRCNAKCECAYVREICNIILECKRREYYNN